MPLGAHKAAMMGTAGVSTGDVVLLATQNASDSSTLAFTSGIDSTYSEYIFKFYNIESDTNEVDFSFNGSDDGGSSYDVAKASTAWRQFHFETTGSGSGEGYQTSYDLSSSDAGTVEQTLAFTLAHSAGSADHSVSGELHIFGPSSTTFMTQYYSTMQQVYSDETGPATVQMMTAGFFNVADDINAIRFKMSSGNIEAGRIKLWGVK